MILNPFSYTLIKIEKETSHKLLFFLDKLNACCGISQKKNIRKKLFFDVAVTYNLILK